MKKLFLILIILFVLTVGLFVYVKHGVEDEFGIVFFDVGQGDSTLINFVDGSRMLVDCGKDKAVLYKLGKYIPFFDRQIDYLLITHFDLDHYGGCNDVLKRYDVKNIITNGIPGTDRYYKEYERIEELENAEMSIVNEYKKISIGSSTIEFLSPLEEFNFTDKNDASVVFKLSNSSTIALFVGDLEEKGEEKLLEKYCSTTSVIPDLIRDISKEVRDRKDSDFRQNDSGVLSNINQCEILNSEILKVGHHGSSGSSSEEFLQAVSPQKSIISVGRNNFGHPSRRVIKKLERISSEILRTDLIGDVTVLESVE